MYNLTFAENLTGFVPFLTGINSATNELFIGLILITIFVISFIGFKSYETITALRTSGFIVSVLAILFNAGGWLSIQYTLMPIVVTGLILLYDIASKE